MPQLSLSLMGPFQVSLDGDPVIAFESDKVRALLAYLSVESDRPHRRETLAGLLWPERTERSARQNLSQALFNLRHIIGDRDAQPPFLLITPKTLQFNRSSDHWLDVTAFEALLTACESHRHRRLEACGSCAERLRQAVALYRGTFLEGFSLGDTSAFEEWALLEQERLHRLVMDSLCHLANRHERRGEYGQMLEYAWRQVALDPWREKAHRQVMHALALSGRRNEALAQYETCRRALEKELGVEPEEETRALYERIRDGREVLTRVPAPPSNLPASLTPFVGREKELARIEDRLQDRDCRFLTLVGPGGIGKTRLAIEVGAAQRYAFDHGVFFVSLAPLQSVETIVPTVAQVLSFSFYEGAEPKQQLLDYLRQKNLLLIMDNFEHLLDGAGLVTNILKTAPDIAILVTSRTRLNVQGEQLFPVAGMDVPDEDVLKDATQFSAVELFLTSAHRVHPGFKLTVDNSTDVARICHLVEGMPLGIMLAAAWMEMLTPTEIAAEISQSLDFLETGLRDVPERQRSMRSVFDHSWRLLSERERDVFQGLSVFRGGFTREAARHVTNASLRELMVLVNKSLFQYTSAGRYEVHELLRGYAAEKLIASGKASATRDAHSVYYAEFLHERAEDLKGRRQLGALKEIDTDFENVRVAWNRALEQKNYSAIEYLLRSLGLYCTYRSRDQELAELLQQAREHLTPGPGDEAHPVWARIPVAEFYANPLGADRGDIKMSLAIAQRYGDREMIGYSLRTLGEIALNDDDLENARSYFEESLPHFRDLDDRFNTAATLHKLAQTYRLLGQPELAIQLARQSLQLSRRIGDRFWSASSLAGTGIIAFYTGNYSEAEDYLQEANTIYREMRFKVGIAASNVVLRALVSLGDDREKFNALSKEALEIAAEIGRKHITRSVSFLPRCLAREFESGWDRRPDEPEPVPITEVPPTIGKFAIKELVATGGMGVVYLAHDPDSGRDVAIKTTHPGYKDKWVCKALRHEAETMSKLEHPAIPECYGYGETADRIFLIIEFIDGKNLEEMLDEHEGFLPEKDIVEWALQICDALIYLHSQKPTPIIFRDMKLCNVMVDQNGQVRLVDLGIVEAYHAGREQKAIGTVGYSPPEQCVGYTDARSDIYALGVTLHHLLTRRDPRQEHKRKDDHFTFHDVPPRSLNPAISEKLEAVILKAVEKHPEDRYQSVKEMKAALLTLRVAALPPEVVTAAQERGRARDPGSIAAELLAELEE